jgi:hypothetical protein
VSDSVELDAVRGHLWAPGGFVVQCKGCVARESLTWAEKKRSGDVLRGRGWKYLRAWYCGSCADDVFIG